MHNQIPVSEQRVGKYDVHGYMENAMREDVRSL